MAFPKNQRQNLLIIGGNSKIYQKYGALLNEHFEVESFSHVFFKSNKIVCEFDITLILSSGPLVADNIALYRDVRNNVRSKCFVLLSSLAATLPISFDYYSYVRCKRYSEIEFESSLHGVVLRGGTFYDTEPPPVGTKIDLLIKSLKSIQPNESGYINLGVDISKNQMPSKLYRRLFSLRYYNTCRIFDVIYRLTGMRNYGYTFALQQQVLKEVAE